MFQDLGEYISSRCPAYTRGMRPLSVQHAMLSAVLVTTPVMHLFGQAGLGQRVPAFEVASIKRADAFAERPGRLGSVNVSATPIR